MTTRRKLSPIRVFLALLITAGMVYYGVSKVETIKGEVEMITYEPWFAGYVDVTSTPTYAFEQLGGTSTHSVILSFIVASNSDPCEPTWGAYYDIEDASEKLDLDRRIARLQQQGGRVAISFGGALNSELSLSCEDPNKLYEAYKKVIDHYNIDTIDLDLENQSLSNKEALERRADVIARLQRDRRINKKSLAVWLTLPVAPQGLTKDGTDAVAQMLASGVDLAGVNLMTMDYGQARAEGQSMLQASKSALIESNRQLGILYEQAGINLNSNTIWAKIGATPMIGQNDIADEVFTLDDAIALNQFALERRVGRMSMWSMNRDVPCGENYVDVKVVSDSCSGVTSEKGSFALALRNGFEGDLTQNSTLLTVEDPDDNQLVVDDPATSPYQIWQENGAYPKGVKVVWRGNVYEAKWWTKNDLPDNPVLQSWETPWQLVGPVLPGETPIKQPTLPEGTYPKWTGSAEYDGGDRVLFEGIPFQAKWWNQGQSPAASAANTDSSPWMPLTQKQIEEILEGME